MESETSRLLDTTDFQSIPEPLGLPDERTLLFLSRLGRHIAHEFNNSIGVISSSVFLVKDIINSPGGRGTSSDTEPFLSAIEDECKKLKSVVEEYSKYISTFSVMKVPINIVEFIQSAAREMEHDGHPVKAVVPNKEIFVDADPRQLGIALRNTIDFAIFEEASSVMMFLEVGQYCSIAITDNRASRSSPADLRKAFSPTPFGHVRARGLGLKLPLVERILALHGGTVEFPDELLGQTEVRLVLPIGNTAKSSDS